MRPTPKIWQRLTRVSTLLWALWAIGVTAAAEEVVAAVLGYTAALLVLWVVAERFPVVPSHTAFSVASLATPLLSLPFLRSDLAHPESTVGFTLALLALAASAIGAVVGLGLWARLPDRTAVVVSFVIGAAFLAGAMAAVMAGLDVEDDQSQRNDLVVLADHTEFRPSALTVEAGRTGFYVENRDRFRHTFTIDEVGLEVELPAGSARRIVVDLEPGAHRIVCRVPGHGSMVVEVTVTG